MRLPVNHLPPLAALVLLSGCGAGQSGGAAMLPAAPVNGPSADFPVVVGDPFTIDDVTYTPVDTLNYDAVGLATVSSDAGAGVSGAHKTLPLPSYVEVTNLDTGRTILVRLDRRGPMTNAALIELSADAADQLGIVAGEANAVRVRRTNPPEPERAMLRSGGRAPERMDTPKPLLDVLKRKLAREEPLALAKPAPTAPVTETDAAPLPQPGGEAAPPMPAPQPSSESKPERPAVPAGSLVVQAAAFSTKARADKAAKTIGGFVTKPGQYWYLQLGPFASQAEARAALEKAKAAGYSDARIQRAD